MSRVFSLATLACLTVASLLTSTRAARAETTVITAQLVLVSEDLVPDSFLFFPPPLPSPPGFDGPFDVYHLVADSPIDGVNALSFSFSGLDLFQIVPRTGGFSVSRPSAFTDTTPPVLIPESFIVTGDVSTFGVNLVESDTELSGIVASLEGSILGQGPGQVFAVLTTPAGAPPPSLSSLTAEAFAPIPLQDTTGVVVPNALAAILADGEIDGFDLAVLAAGFSFGDLTTADLNGDGALTGADASVISALFGQAPFLSIDATSVPVVFIPEPSSLAVFCVTNVALVTQCRTRRRH